MNERYRLNSELIKAWLDNEARKYSFISRELRVSDSLVAQMMSIGHVPKERTLDRLADLMGVSRDKLLLPKTGAKKTA